MLFSGIRFDPVIFKLTSTRYPDDRIVKITVKFTNVKKTGDYAKFQVFNFLLHNCLRHLKLTLIRRNFYDSDAKIDMAQYKLQLWLGYETTTDWYEDNILLFVGVSIKVMRQEIVRDRSLMTYIQYYKEKLNIKICGGRQPMLQKSLRQYEVEDMLVYLLSELYIMTGITNTMSNDFTFMKDMAIHTSVNPKERMVRLIHFAIQLLSIPDPATELKRWNLTLSNKVVELTGRTLQPEPIQSSMVDGKSNTFSNTLKKVINESNSPLILCVIPSKRVDVYSMNKPKLYIDRAVPSQVVRLKNMQKNNLFVCTKIVIQLDCKLSGAPWLAITLKKWMMIGGFDVWHDSQQKNKSFEYLVSTMNDAHTSYFIFFYSVKPYTSGEKLSVNFATDISKSLDKNRTKNCALLISIIIYRYEVGKGQILYVHKIEVRLLQTACEQLNGASSVPLAFVIVTKRISARFFVHSNRGPGNPRPGAIIDSVVTDPTKYDFFLVSQYVRQQDTVTPTHYQVIEDILRLPPNIMQRLTLKLTHMCYNNWLGTVWIPAPCLLAHKLAFLTGQSVGYSPNIDLDELLYFL